VKTDLSYRWIETCPRREITYGEPEWVGNHKVEFHDRMSHYFPAKGVLFLKDAFLYGSQGVVRSKEGKSKSFLPILWPSQYETKFKYFEKPHNTESLSGNVAAIFSPWAQTNYCHFVLDCLSRLKTLRDAGFDDKDISKYILPIPPSGFCNELVRRTDIDQSKIIWAKDHDLFVCENLIVPSYPGSARTYDDTIKYIHSLRENNFDLNKKRRIYIERGKSKRKILNNSQIYDVLDKYNFEIFDERSFEKADKIFAEANLIVGAHGAGMANLIFCQPHTKVFEIMPSSWPTPFFFSLSKVLNLDYSCMLGISEGNIFNDVNSCNANMTIEIPVFEKQIERLVLTSE